MRAESGYLAGGAKSWAADLFSLTRRETRKVPEVVVIFWIIKVLSTALGESTSDYLVYNMIPEVAVLLGFIGLVIALFIQFAARRYTPWKYWLAVVMVAIFGTMAADVLHIQFGIPYVVTSAFFAVVLVIVFVVWYRGEHTLSIHTIYNPRREVYYWATVMATFALGTATGDMTAITLHLGYFWSGIVFAALIAVPVIGWKFLGWNAIFAFWFAYVITRPLGASFADWTGKPPSLSGLGWGDGIVSAVLSVGIVALVGYLTVTRVDTVEHAVNP